MERLSRHEHIVELIGSYTDPRTVAILTNPVAEYNLEEHFSRGSNQAWRPFLKTFFSCLAAALCFLHDNRIRHKDIKPQNVLVNDGKVLLTDFGLALDWTDKSRSRTSGPAWSTPLYGAPEVAEGTMRTSASDLWSLGCVFLEIWTVLNGNSTHALRERLSCFGTQSIFYCTNLQSVDIWIENITVLPPPVGDKFPATWIKNMLQHDQDQR